MADTLTAGLTQRVSEHMARVFPFRVDAGGWTVARDSRDETAVVVWRPGYEPAQPQVRGALLYRWLCSLRDAGFEGEARLDLACFGRPNQTSSDGIARWLHVTGWTAPVPSVTAPLPPLRPEDPRCTVPLPSSQAREFRCPLSGVLPSEAQFVYRQDGIETVLVYETADLHWGTLVPRPPAWLRYLAERNRPGGEAR